MLRYPCPGVEVIQRLLLGKGEELELRLFEEHLQRCEACFALLQRVKVEDSLVKDLENTGSLPAGMPGDAVLQPLLDRLYRLPKELAERPGRFHDDATDRSES